MKYIYILIIFIFALSCNSAPPRHSEPDNSSIGITIAYSDIKAEEIVFVKLNSMDGPLTQSSIILSEYSYESWWGNIKSGSTDNFLLNAEPGIYAAVVAYGRVDSTHYLILFPEKMVKSTIVEVKAKTMVYTGKYYFDSKNIFEKLAGEKDKADNVQKYYYKPLIQEFYKHNSQLIRLHIVIPALTEIQRSKDMEIKFLKGYQGVFKKTDWKEKINNRLKDLE